MSAVAARRPGETVEDAAIRNGIDAVYAARDSGGTMHDAGEAAARAVISLYSAEPSPVAGAAIARARGLAQSIAEMDTSGLPPGATGVPDIARAIVDLLPPPEGPTEAASGTDVRPGFGDRPGVTPR